MKCASVYSFLEEEQTFLTQLFSDKAVLRTGTAIQGLIITDIFPIDLIAFHLIMQFSDL